MANKIYTIGREFGSGGREVGEKLAAKLGIKLYDKELLQQAAKDSGFCEEIFENHDEKPTNSFLYSLVMDTYSVSGYSAAPFLDMPLNHKVFLAQFETIKKIAEKESCVIVGKCADYVLKGRKNVVSIYIEAPRAFCLERTMQRMKLSSDVAAATIENTDKYRADYYKYYTKGNYWTNPVNYDMTLNSEKVGIAGCVKMIEEYLVMKGLITREQILSEQITKGEEKK